MQVTKVMIDSLFSHINQYISFPQSYSLITEASTLGISGVSCESFNIEVNAKDYGFQPTDTPRTDRSVIF